MQLRLRKPPRVGPAVRRRHRPRAVAAAPRARAADRVADEDDDRARGGRPGARRRKVQDHQGGARLHGLGRRAAAARQADPGRHDAVRAAAAVGQRRGDRARAARRGLAGALRRADEPSAPRRWACVCTHFSTVERDQGPRQPLVRAGPGGDGPRGAPRAPPGPDRPPPLGRAAVPDQGPQALPLQQQPAAAGRLPRHHRHQDRLHRRGRPLPGGDRAARADPPRRRAARLARPRPPGDALLDRGFAVAH